MNDFKLSKLIGPKLVILLLVFIMSGLILWGYITGNITLSRASTIRLSRSAIKIKEVKRDLNNAFVDVKFSVQAGGGLKAITALDFVILYNNGGGNYLAIEDDFFQSSGSNSNAAEAKNDYFSKNHFLHKELEKTTSKAPMRERVVLTTLQSNANLASLTEFTLRFTLRKKPPFAVDIAVEGCSARIAGIDNEGNPVVADIKPDPYDEDNKANIIKYKFDTRAEPD